MISNRIFNYQESFQVVSVFHGKCTYGKTLQHIQLDTIIVMAHLSSSILCY